MMIPKELMEKYRQSIPDKLNKIHQLILEVERSGSKESRDALRLAVHRLAGSAGTYGYGAVSTICQELEQNIVHNIEPLMLNQFYNKLKEAFLK